MSPESFQYILNFVGSTIQKKKKPASEKQYLLPNDCLTIHYLAYGNSQQDLSFTYRIGRSTVSIIHETCEAIWDSLCEQYCR